MWGKKWGAQTYHCPPPPPNKWVFFKVGGGGAHAPLVSPTPLPTPVTCIPLLYYYIQLLKKKIYI